MKKIFALAFAAFACLANGAVKVGYELHDDIGGEVPVVIDAWGAVSNEVNAVVADKAWLTVSNDVMTAIKKKSWGAVYHSMTNWVTKELNAKITKEEMWAKVDDNVYLAISQRAWSAVSTNIVSILQTMFDEQFGDREGVSKEYVSAMITSSYANMYRQLWDAFYGNGYDYYVDAVNGNDNHNGVNPQAPYKTIDAALLAIEKDYKDGTITQEEVKEKRIAVMAGSYSYPTNGNYVYASIPYNLYAIQGKEKTKICPMSDDPNGYYGIHGVNPNLDWKKQHYIKGFTIEGFNRKSVRYTRGYGYGALFWTDFEECDIIGGNEDETKYFDYYHLPIGNCLFEKCRIINGRYKGDKYSWGNGGFTIFFGSDFFDCLISGNEVIDTASAQGNNSAMFYGCNSNNTTIYDDTEVWAVLTYGLTNLGAKMENTKFFILNHFASAPAYFGANIYKQTAFNNCVFGVGESGFVPTHPTRFVTDNVYNGGFVDTYERYMAGETSQSYIPLFGKVTPQETAVRNWVLAQGYARNNESLLGGGLYISPNPNDGKLMVFNLSSLLPTLQSAKVANFKALKANAYARFKQEVEDKATEKKYWSLPTRDCPELKVCPEDGEVNEEDY